MNESGTSVILSPISIDWVLFLHEVHDVKLTNRMEPSENGHRTLFQRVYGWPRMLIAKRLLPPPPPAISPGYTLILDCVSRHGQLKIMNRYRASNRMGIYQNCIAVVTNNFESYWTNSKDHEPWQGGLYSQIVNGCPFSFRMLVKYSVPEPNWISIHAQNNQLNKRYLWYHEYAN